MSLLTTLSDELEQMSAAGTLKKELSLKSPQGPVVTIEGRGEVIMLTSNNYLGLADHPAIVEAAEKAERDFGYGLASVRFICGTQTIHRELEQRISEFLGTEDTILYSSCFDANAGLFESILTAEDAVISDELNHASVIDGIRLCKAQRLRYRNGDMDDLERCLTEAAGARHRLIATDGVFSMDGYLANLKGICELAERHDALVMVDDSHAVGFVGPRGRGTPEHFGVVDRVDVLTGTLGKAMGGASGGYASGRREIVEILRQRSRPYLFSNSLAPPIVGAALATLDLLETSDELRTHLAENTAWFRERMSGGGFEILPGEHPIVPVMFGDAVAAGRFARGLLDHGVYAVSFTYPVVPKGKARIRTQMSAAHTPEQIDRAADAFAKVGRALGAIR